MPRKFTRQRQDRFKHRLCTETMTLTGEVRLRQRAGGEDQVCETQRGRKKNRCPQARMTQQSSNRRTEHEAKAKGGANHSHSMSPFRFAGGVRDIRLGGRDRRRESAVNRARNQEPEK